MLLGIRDSYQDTLTEDRIFRTPKDQGDHV